MASDLPNHQRTIKEFDGRGGQPFETDDMNLPVKKSRYAAWLLCLHLAAAGQALALSPSVLPAQYYPYAYPPADSSPYDFAPNQNLPEEQWPYSDSDIRRTVRSQFVLDTFLDAINIRFRVQDGVVILTGRVKTWDNRSRAEIDAYGAGARVVLNQLKVLPY